MTEDSFKIKGKQIEEEEKKQSADQTTQKVNDTGKQTEEEKSQAKMQTVANELD